MSLNVNTGKAANAEIDVLRENEKMDANTCPYMNVGAE